MRRDGTGLLLGIRELINKQTAGWDLCNIKIIFWGNGEIIIIFFVGEEDGSHWLFSMDNECGWVLVCPDQ